MFKDMTDEKKKKYWREHKKYPVKRKRLKNERTKKRLAPFFCN